MDAGRGKIGLHRGTAPFTGTVPSWVQFEGVKLSSGRVTIRVPGVGYCAGKHNGPSECSIDVRSSDAIEVECLAQCGRIAGPAKEKGKKKKVLPCAREFVAACVWGGEGRSEHVCARGGGGLRSSDRASWYRCYYYQCSYTVAMW